MTERTQDFLAVLAAVVAGAAIAFTSAALAGAVMIWWAP